MQKVVLATGNAGKVRELASLLSDFGLDIVAQTECKKLSSQPAMPVKCVSWRRCLATSVLISLPKQTSA